MSCCEHVHQAFDEMANEDIQVGGLPAWTRVSDRVAWYVYQGPYAGLSTKGWDVFCRKFATSNLTMEGVPGDLYACSPGCHKEDRQERMLTIFWAPLRSVGKP